MSKDKNEPVEEVEEVIVGDYDLHIRNYELRKRKIGGKSSYWQPEKDLYDITSQLEMVLMWIDSEYEKTSKYVTQLSNQLTETEKDEYLLDPSVFLDMRWHKVNMLRSHVTQMAKDLERFRLKHGKELNELHRTDLIRR